MKWKRQNMSLLLMQLDVIAILNCYDISKYLHSISYLAWTDNNHLRLDSFKNYTLSSIGIIKSIIFLFKEEMWTQLGKSKWYKLHRERTFESNFEKGDGPRLVKKQWLAIVAQYLPLNKASWIESGSEKAYLLRR